MRETPAKSGMGRDILLTTATSVAVLVANLVVSAILARAGTVEVFGAFNLVKRLAASALPLITLGLTVGVVKHVAAADHPEARAAQQLSALLVVAGVIVGVSLGLLLFPELAIHLLLGSGSVWQLWCLWAYTVALCLNAMVFSYYRAELRQTRANITNALAYAIVPIAVVVFMPPGTDGYLYAAGVAAFVLLINSTELLIRVIRLCRPSSDAMRLALRDLLAYSIPRVPSGVAVALLLVFSPWYANRTGHPLIASYLLAALALSQLVSASLQAFGIVLLPRISILSAEGDHARLRDISEKLTVGALVPSLCAVPFLVLFAEPLVGAWLGESMLPATAAVLAVAVALPAVSLYNVQRSIADGAIKAPVNTYAAVGGLAVCAALSLVVPATSLSGLAAAYAAGQWVAAAVLFAAIVRALGVRIPWLYLCACLIASAAIAFGSHFATSAAGIMLQLSTGIATAVATVCAAVWFAPARIGLRQALTGAFRVGGTR